MARILYIEDDEKVRQCTTLMLKRADHSVLPRIDTDKINALVSIWKPDLVITDHNLGEGKEKGLQVALRLKADRINVVMLSGNYDALKGASAANIPFFSKPCSIASLLSEIEI